MRTPLNKKADMGIGFLIILIAMIIVASMAAGVLLTVAQNMQQKALLTGSRTRSEISSMPRIITLFAENGFSGNLTFFCAKMAVGPGSDPLSFEDMLIEFDTESASSDKIYGSSPTQVDNTVPTQLDPNYVDLNQDGLVDSVFLLNPTTVQVNVSAVALFNITIPSIAAASSTAPVSLRVFDRRLNLTQTDNYGSISIVGEATTPNNITGTSRVFISTGNGAYSVQYLINGTSHANKFLVRGDVALVCFATPNAIGPDKDFSIRFVPKVGHVALIDTASPDAYTNVREYLFP